MNVEFWLYYYLTNTIKLFPEDEEDRLDIERKIVELCPSCTQKFENGFYLGKYLQKLV